MLAGRKQYLVMKRCLELHQNIRKVMPDFDKLENIISLGICVRLTISYDYIVGLFFSCLTDCSSGCLFPAQTWGYLETMPSESSRLEFLSDEFTSGAYPSFPGVPNDRPDGRLCEICCVSLQGSRALLTGQTQLYNSH